MYDYNESHLSGTDLDYIYNDDGPIYMNRKSAPSYKFLRNKKSETKVKEPDTLPFLRPAFRCKYQQKTGGADREPTVPKYPLHALF